MARASSETPDAATRDPQRVRAMFSRIAPRYDLANHLLSGGVDFLWRRRAARIVSGWHPQRVLDVAAGSGDLALALQRILVRAKIIASDFSEAMLEIARRKGVRQTVIADALNLPFPDASFDAVTIAFGLRNLADWERGIREMHRILTPGGHLLVLDFSIPSGPLRHAYRFYLHHILPSAAAFITGEPSAYEYLGSSIERFPSGRDMLDLLEENGFGQTRAETLSGGIATIYTGRVAD